MKIKKTLVSIKRYAETYGYTDLKDLLEEAKLADAVFPYAGADHIWVEAMDIHIQKVASQRLAKHSKQSNTLANTMQLGIIRSNLKRLPDAIAKKERRLKAIEALLSSATSDSERLSLRTEKRTLRDALEQHRENLKNAQAASDRMIAARSAELAALESEDNDSQKKSADTINKK